MTAQVEHRHYQYQDPAKPLELLFGSRSPRARTAFEVHELIERGFPSEAVIGFVQSITGFKDKQVFVKIIGLSDRTLQRRIKNPEPLTSEQSSSAWRLAKVFSKAEEILGDRQQAANWMITPALGLEGRAPMDLLTTQVGFELVDDFLTRMDYGVYS
jgi:putative toxin-antitoxin system antitoxin component (TIGR02293 family)